MKVVKVDDAWLRVGVKVCLIELIKLFSWVTSDDHQGCSSSCDLMMMTKDITISDDDHHSSLSPAPPPVSWGPLPAECHLHLSGMNDPSTGSSCGKTCNPDKQDKYFMGSYYLCALRRQCLLTNITTVTEPPKSIERGRNFERLSCKYILNLETGGSSSLSMSAFVERVSTFSSWSVWMFLIMTNQPIIQCSRSELTVFLITVLSQKFDIPPR